MDRELAAGEFRPRPSVLLIAGGGSAARLGEEAIALAGARAIGPVGYADAAAQMAVQSADAVLIEAVLIEAGDGDAEALSLALDAAATLAAAGDAAIVVTFDEAKIDQVAARLLTGRVQLLCSPSDAERVAALAIALAGKQGSRVRQNDRDIEAERLRQLNEDVARIAETLARLTRSEPGVGGRAMLGDRSLAYRSAPGGEGDVAPAEIRQAIRARRLRDQFFGPGLFEDPAWDMLLDLFAADLERARVSVSSLCIAAAVAPTTALRWIGRMTEAGLFEREADPFDRRRAFMQLSAKARDGMQSYWTAVKRTGAAIG